MELTRMVPLVAFFIFFVFPWIQGRTQNHHHHRQHQKTSIAMPQMANSPVPSPEPSMCSGMNSTNSTAIAPAPSPISISSSEGNPANDINVFNVRSFGAVGDSVSDDTEAFKSAWDSACQAGSAVVLVPKGHSFMIQSTIFTGPCQGSIVFQVDGVIMPPDGPDSWPPNIHKRQWIVFYRVDGMALQGGGLIDGRGDKWWNLPCKPHKGANRTIFPGPCDSPVALRFSLISNITLYGLKIRNSPQFHVRFDNCRNVTVDSITISSPALSPNTDGIHVENTNTVGIYNSVISSGEVQHQLQFSAAKYIQTLCISLTNSLTGDDCVSIGAGSFNVDIRNVTCGPSHGISIGSLGKQKTRACVRNITARNTVIKHSDNGVRIKTWQGGYGSVSSVTFENIRMDTVRNPIIIDQYYCPGKGCANQTAAVTVSRISYTNIKGTYDIRSPAMHFGCSDSVPCTNITLTEVELLPAVGELISDPFCWNVYGATQTPTIPPVFCMLNGLPQTILDADADKCY